MPVSDEVLTYGLTAMLGYGGKAAVDSVRSWRARKRSDAELRSLHRQQFHRPLLDTTRDFQAAIDTIVEVYDGCPGAPSTPPKLAGDFRELFLLRPDQIPEDASVLDSDGNDVRRDPRAVQQLRRRMCYQLNLATSMLYRTARYLAQARLVQGHLAAGSSLAPDDQDALDRQLAAVRDALSGPTGAGIFSEQQDSIAEIMLGADGRILTHHDFRQRLLELPGWEQFTALFLFFVSEDDELREDGRARLYAKLDHEVAATAVELERLKQLLERICAEDAAEGARRQRSWSTRTARVGAPSDPGISTGSATSS